MVDRVQDTSDGAMGHFWVNLADVYDLDKSTDGYVRLSDDNFFHISTLRTREYVNELGRNHNRLPWPDAIYAMTNSTRAIFFDIAGVSQSNVMGQRASTQTIRTRGVVVNVPFAALKDDKFLAVELEIPQVTRWAGLTSIRETLSPAEAGGSKQYRAETVDVQPLELDVRRGFKLKLDSTWHVDGPDDKRTINAPLVVGTSSRTPRKWHDHLVPLLSVQDLINLAHDGFVPAERATVEFQIEDDGQPRESSELWNSRLMALPRQGGVGRPNSMTEVPLFYLSQIGGVRGLRNWIRLDQQHPRATGPLTSTYRYGASGPEVRLVEIALGLEYWTNLHNGRLKRAWAKPRKRGRRNEPLPMALGRYVGPAFTDFVGGDLGAWADAFWGHYNSLKHAPNFEYDPDEVKTLAESGGLLLLGGLLNRVAGSRVPMTVLARSVRTQRLKQRIQELIATTNSDGWA